MMASLVTTRPMTVAYLAAEGSYDQIPAGFGSLYGWLEEHGLVATDMPMGVFFNIPSDPSGADAIWELWAPVKGGHDEALPDTSGIGVRHVPPMSVISATHKGPYETMESTYQALWIWISDNGYVLDGPAMERYYSDPTDVPSDEYVTEIMLPVRRA